MDADELLDGLTSTDLAELIAALERRGLLKGFVAAVETEEWSAPTADELMAELSDEGRRRVETARAAMVAKFGLRHEDVSVIAVPIDDADAKPVVMMTTGNGLKRGCWDDILGERETHAFTIEVEDVAIDTRAGMTWIAYQALIRELEHRGVTALPDSSLVAEQSDQPWTCTLLTGDEMNGGRAPFAFVNDGKPGRSWGGRDYRGGLRFRPAAVIE